MKLFKLLLAAAGATVLLGTLVSTATAGHLEASALTTRATFRRVDFIGGFGTTECEITLEGSLHERTITKERELLIGYITNARVATRCIKGSATILQESLPWHVRYESFTGTLPNITSFITTTSGSRFQIKEPVFGITCLAERGIPRGTYRREAGRNLTEAIISGTSPTNCGTTGTLAGTSTTLTRLNETGRIVLNLI